MTGNDAAGNDPAGNDPAGNAFGGNDPGRSGAVFEALADPTRREVMRRLAEGGPATATELAADLPVTRQAVAKHLVTLTEAGLVASDRQGRETRFSFTPQPLTDAVSWMADVGREWDDRLQALSRYLETGEPRPKRRRAGFDTDR